MKKLRISIKEFITFYSINNLNKAKIPIYHAIYNHSALTGAVIFYLKHLHLHIMFKPCKR